MLNPTEGIYSLCSKITSFKGIMLDSGSKLKKNQNIPNEDSLYLENLRIAIAKIDGKKRMLKRTDGSNKDF